MKVLLTHLEEVIVDRIYIQIIRQCDQLSTAGMYYPRSSNGICISSISINYKRVRSLVVIHLNEFLPSKTEYKTVSALVDRRVNSLTFHRSRLLSDSISGNTGRSNHRTSIIKQLPISNLSS
jgi:hypothetical protein